MACDDLYKCNLLLLSVCECAASYNWANICVNLAKVDRFFAISYHTVIFHIEMSLAVKIIYIIQQKYLCGFCTENRFWIGEIF